MELSLEILKEKSRLSTSPKIRFNSWHKIRNILNKSREGDPKNSSSQIFFNLNRFVPIIYSHQIIGLSSSLSYG